MVRGSAAPPGCMWPRPRRSSEGDPVTGRIAQPEKAKTKIEGLSHTKGGGATRKSRTETIRELVGVIGPRARNRPEVRPLAGTSDAKRDRSCRSSNQDRHLGCLRYPVTAYSRNGGKASLFKDLCDHESCLHWPQPSVELSPNC
jgi:hypothetical protein